jgi:hypothetical protein
MTKEELRAPDEVQMKLQGLWTWIENYWRHLAISAAVLVVGGGVVTVMDDNSQVDVYADADALSEALAPLSAPVGDAPAGVAADADEVRYENRAAALTAANTAIDAYVSARPNSKASGALSALAPAVAAQAGDPKGAAQKLAEWVTANPNSSLQASALHALAEARAASDDIAGALEAYRTLAAQSSGSLKALAFMAMGDLQNPLSAKDGDVTKARTAYEEASKALGPRPKTPPGDIYAALTEPYLYAEIENRLALLQ